MTEIILAGDFDASHDCAPKFERISRVQSIEPGNYVKATNALPDELIPVDEILPIEDVHYVDNVPHTVWLRAHPKHYGQRDTRAVEYSRTFELIRHEFRISDFLNNFVSVTQEEAQARRDAERQTVHARINQMQQDIAAAQSDPDKINRIVAEGLAKKREARGEAEPNTLPAISDQLPPLTLGTAMRRGVDETSVMQLRQDANHQLDVATIKAEWLQSQTQLISQAIQEMVPYYSEQADVMVSSTKGMQEHVGKILEGIKSLDLFLGKDVQVVRVSQGASAPSNVPLSILQRKLIMVEEMAVFMPVHAATDYRKLDAFLDELGSNKELADQIFPSERAIVCMAATRRSVQYGQISPYESAIYNLNNSIVFLLARDGANIFYISSPVESHVNTPRLFPTKSETGRPFVGSDGSEITFDSLRYTQALSAFERLALHYKRLLIMICGLDHRENLFGNFYEGPKDFSFISMEFQERYFRLISDDDESTMLPGGVRPGPVLEWFSERNKFLTSGSRVFCDWKSLARCESACPGSKMSSTRSLDHAPSVAVAFRHDGTEAVELELERGKAMRKLKIYPRRYRGSDDAYRTTLDRPYLVLDDVEPEQLAFYIFDRKSRVESVEYLRLFRKALDWLKAEREIEAPARAMMLDAVITNGVCPADRALPALNHAIRLWRASNRGKALPTCSEAGSVAWTEVLDVVYMIEHAANSQIERVQSFINETGLQPVRLCVTGKARLVLYCEPSETERDDRLTPHVWLHRIVLRLGRRTITEQTRSWALLKSFDAAEHTIAVLGDEQIWCDLKSSFQSLAEKKELFAVCERGIQKLRTLATSAEAVEQLARDYLQTRQLARVKHKSVPTIGAHYPIGLVLTKHGDVEVLTLGDNHAREMIYALLEDGPAKKRFHYEEVRRYVSPDSHVADLMQSADRRTLARHMALSITTQAGGLVFDKKPTQEAHISRWDTWYKGWSLDEMYLEARRKQAPRDSWLPEGIEPGNSETGFDALFGLIGKNVGLQSACLWRYVPDLETETGIESPVAAFYVASADRSYLITGYDKHLVGFWLSEAERDAYIANLRRQKPELVHFETAPKGYPTVHGGELTLYLPR